MNEAYLRLVTSDGARWENRAHFFAVAARAMRHILVDHARARRAAKRGGAAAPVPLDELRHVISDEQAERLVALDDALTQLTEVDPEAGQTVECRYFGGLTLEETAAALDLSVATVRRLWGFAKAWLHRELQAEI